jgi:hypothetical protein
VLLRVLARYPNVTSTAYKNLESLTIILYLINITNQLPMCLETEEGEESEAILSPAEFAFSRLCDRSCKMA